MYILRVFFILLIGYVLLLTIIYILQRKLQYFPTHFDKEGRGNSVFKPWFGKQGQFMGYILSRKNPSKVVLFFHGNGGEAIDRVWIAEILSKSVTIILVEYPGYGARKGEISERSFFLAAEEAYDEAKAQFSVPVIVMAESLGTGIACYLGAHKRIEGLFLISPFSSGMDVARFHYPYLPVKWLMKDRYLSIEYLKEARVPLHIIHGAKDNIVPIKLAQKLFESYKGGEKSFTVLPNSSHNDMAFSLMTSPDAKPFLTLIK